MTNKNSNPSSLLSRRDLLKMGFTTAFVSFLPSTGVSLFLNSSLTEIDSAINDEPVLQFITGRISSNDFDIIVTFAQWLFDTWEFDGFLSYKDQLKNLVESKTTIVPSYLTEYQNAAKIIRETSGSNNNWRETFLSLSRV